MNELRSRHFGSLTNNTAARRRQIRAARKRVAATRARMAELYATTASTPDSPGATDTSD